MADENSTTDAENENMDLSQINVLTVVDLSSTNLEKLPQVLLEASHIKEVYLDYNDLSDLPEDLFKHLINLELFSISGNRLTAISESIVCWQKLQELCVCENDLTSLPSSLGKLKNLKTLKLTGNSLSYLPHNLGNLSNLEKLYADENELKKLPATFGLLYSLTNLDLSSNTLEEIFSGIGKFQSLEYLNLSGNELTVIPESFHLLEQLKIVDFSDNRLASLPKHCRSCNTLKKFYAESNLLADLPNWIDDLTEVVELSLKNNQFQHQTLSNNFGKNSNHMKLLDVSGNFMSQLPESIGELTSLEFCHFGSYIGELERRNFQNGNWISYIPNTFCELLNLRELHFDENQLRELPDDFGKLVNLEYLDVGMFVIRSFQFHNVHDVYICMIKTEVMNVL